MTGVQTCALPISKFLYPCYFGTDVDSRENLIAVNHSTEEIAEIIGVDSLGFLRGDYQLGLQTSR